MYKVADSIPPCPLIYALDVVSPKWTVEILRELAMHSVRTRAFLKVIPGLSMKSLAQRLHALQSAGLISRQAFGEKELHVEYTITELGKQVLLLLTELTKLGSKMLGLPISCNCSISGACKPELDCPRRKIQQ